MSIPEPTNEHLAVLRKYFGHNHFRPMQWKIIYSIIEKRRDNCLIMATGYGKSLCYQYPAVYRNSLSIVISPLISLMQDQVLSLNMSNISACFLGSAQTSKSKSLNEIYSGDCRILYVSPEWCTSEIGKETLEKIKSIREITLIAVDEAHCVSQWGHDFRHAFRHLNILRKIFEDVPILAVTATATPKVRIDIVKTLSLRNALITCTGFDRPNLYFSVSLKSGKSEDVFRDFQKILIKDGLVYKFPGPTIIYCSTKKRTEEVANILLENGIVSMPYHAGLSLKKRTEVHEKFVNDELSVVVATVAFGMGIDKPDVRCVIHYGAPKEMESYYQEVGRAGRDGLPATCYVFYSSGDFSINSYFIESSSNKKFKDYRRNMSKRMQQYLETQKCRRHLLLSHFDESIAKEQKKPAINCCDNCTKALKSNNQEFNQPDINLVEDVKILLNVFNLFGGRFGMTVPIKFLRGIHDNKITEENKKRELYGYGRDTSEAAWKALARLCLRDGLLEEKSCNSSFFKGRKFPINTVQLTADGKKYIEMGEDSGIVLVPSKEVEILFRSRKKKLDIISHVPDKDKTNYWNDKLEQYRNKKEIKEKEEQSNLYGILRNLRDDLAYHDNVPAHLVASDIMCYNMAVQVPSNVAKLAAIDGFNEARLEKYGKSFIKKIEEFLKNKSDTSEEATEGSSSRTNTALADMFSVQFLNENAVDYGKASCMEYELNELELAEFDHDLSIPDSTAPIKTENIWDEVDDEEFLPDSSVPRKTENIWGEASDDEFFQNVSLEKLKTSLKFSNEIEMGNAKNVCEKIPLNRSTISSPTGENLTNPEKSAQSAFQKSPINERINYDLHHYKPKRKFMYDDVDDDNVVSVVKDTNKNAEPTSSEVQSNSREAILKRTLPTWLTQTDSKAEVKKRIRNNSLFKF